MLSWDEFETPESVKKPTEQEKQAAPVTTAEAKEEKPEETHKEQPKINVSLETGSVSTRLERAKKAVEKKTAPKAAATKKPAAKKVAAKKAAAKKGA